MCAWGGDLPTLGRVRSLFLPSLVLSLPTCRLTRHPDVLLWHFRAVNGNDAAFLFHTVQISPLFAILLQDIPSCIEQLFVPLNVFYPLYCILFFVYTILSRSKLTHLTKVYNPIPALLNSIYQKNIKWLVALRERKVSLVPWWSLWICYLPLHL